MSDDRLAKLELEVEKLRRALASAHVLMVGGAWKNALKHYEERERQPYFQYEDEALAAGEKEHPEFEIWALSTAGRGWTYKRGRLKIPHPHADVLGGF